MGKTIIEKIFSKKAGYEVSAGQSIVCEVDQIMTNDASGPLSISIMKEHGREIVANPSKISIFMDHYTPCPNSQVAGLQQSIMDFQQKNPGIRVTTTGYGICHHLMDEFGLVAPGRLIVGGDSHSTTYGFLNAAGIGVGSTDIAIAMITGKLWFKVPDTIRVDFMGSMRKGVSGKDVALYLVNRIGPNGGSSRAVEFGGSGIANLPINDRKTICNLMAECGAKCGIMPYDEIAEQYCIERGIDHANPVAPDADCVYAERFLVDLDAIEPVIAVPHNVHTIKTVRELTGTPIHMAMLGTCTGGKIDDFREAAQVVRAMDGPFKAEVLVVPASQKILLQMMQEGIADLFVRKGATLLPAGCGSCCGSSPGVPRDGFNVISTANRNFLGRMGNVKANIYLASPQVTAYCAMLGCVGDPTEVLA